MGWTRGPIIGHGSTAVVSTAATDSGNIIAVKSAVLRHSKHLQKEQTFLSKIQCPQVVSYMGYEISKLGNDFFFNLFLEYLPRGDLAQEICRQDGGLKECVVASYARQIVVGLTYLHSLGIAHSDIKPKNILVGPGGVKIADLGCARWGSEEGVAGTLLYMAPEVARGEKQGSEADIWALGCTVIEMTTGRPPWGAVSGGDPTVVLYRIAYSGELPEIPSGLSEEGRDFVGKCLRRDPKERWSASELMEHPFLVKCGDRNETVELKLELVGFNSPTSTLDQGVWNSVDETNDYKTSFEGMDKESDWLRSRLELDQRIRELGPKSGFARWDLDEEGWITVRDFNNY